MNSSALIDHLGWVLVHSLWQFAAIALVAGLLTWMLRWSTSTARYAIEVFAMGLVIAAPLVTWWALPMEEPTVFAAVPETANESLITFPSEGVSEPSSSLQHTWVEETTSSPAAPTDSPVMAAAPVIEAAPSPTWSETVATILHPWMMWIVAGWCAGVVFCSLRPLLGWHTLRRLRTSGVAPVSDEIRMALMRVADRLGLPQSVQVLQSTLAHVPVVVGYLRPVILLPVSLLANLPPSQLEAILAHELAHIRRHDFVINLLQTLVETLCFYHPAVWWLSRRIRIEREHCCDDLVVAVLDNRVEYGRALLAIAELRGIRTLLALGANDGSLVSRIRRIAGFRSEFPTSSPWLSLALLACLFVTLLAISTVRGSDASDPKIESTVLENKFIATLPDGTTVELLGVGLPETTDATKCWGPDGGSFVDLTEWPRPFAPGLRNGTQDLFIRCTGLREHQEVAITSAWLSNIPAEDRGAIRRIGLERTGDVTTLQLGLTEPEWGPWQKFDPKTEEIVGTTEIPKGYEDVYQKHRPIEAESVEQFPNQTGLKWNDQPNRLESRPFLQIVAVDREGKIHNVRRSAGSPDSRQKWTIWTHLFDLPLESVDHFEYRLRPFRYWVTFENISLVAGTNTDVKISVTSPPRPAIAEWVAGHSLEFVGLTKNTAPANNGWQANGLPIGEVGYWKSTTVLHGEGRNSSTYTENGPHPEPDANAIDFLFRFRGLKAQPSLTFEMPTRGVSYSHLPVQEPYDLRVSAWRRPPTPGPGGKWSTPDGVVKVGLTDEPWGRYVKISPDGEVLNPIRADELYASTYKLIDVRGSQPSKRIPNGKAILIREPSANTDPDDPDHRFAFEFRAIDTDGKEHWAMQWEGRGVEQTKWTDSQYGLSQPLPAGKTLSHYEYRLRPFRHWITFENISLEPGPQTEVKYSVKSWPAAASKLKATNADGSPATFNAVNIAQVGFPLTPLHPWIGWRERDGLVPLQTMPFGTHWILAAGEFEQRTIFPLAYPTGMKTIERALRGREPWTKHDLDFKPRFEPGETPGGTIVIRMKNKFEKPLTVSEADFNLVVGERSMHRGLSPQWSDGKFTPVEIAAGQTAEVRLNWNDWVQKGFWASRDGEEIAEPTLPLNEPGRIYVRVCLGNSGALPIAVTDPAVMFPQEKSDEQHDQKGALQPSPATQAQVEQMVRENGITKLTLVYFQDEGRRTIPAVMMGYDLETHIVTSGLAGYVPDGIPEAIDRTFIVDAREKTTSVEYHSGSSRDAFVYRALPGLASADRRKAAALEVGDSVTVIRLDEKDRFYATRNAAVITALNTTAAINHHRLREWHPSGLIELNAPLLEGTLVLKRGALVGIVQVGTRFLGAEAQKCYAVPFDGMQTLSKELAAAKASADAAGERRRVALIKSLVTVTRIDEKTKEPTPKPNRRSGLIVDDRGYILTVFYPGDRADDGFQIRLNDQSEHSSKVVGTDQRLSVALLQISPAKPLNAISLDTIPAAIPDEPVTAIFADRWPSILAGNVTGVGVELDINPAMKMTNLIKTSVVINPGDGGSLMANVQDQPMGVWHAIRVGKERLSFAIPLKDVVPFVTEHVPPRQQQPIQEKPAEAATKDERTSLLDAMIKEPKLETLGKLLAVSENKGPTPTELLDDSRRHSGKEKMGGEVKTVNTGKDRFAIVSAKVIPLIDPSDVAIRVDPERRAECAFVFDMQGRLIDTIGGKLSGGNSLSGDDIHIVNLGPEEDWFVRVMNFEKRGELTYRSDYYRIANPVVKSFRFCNHPNSCAWSHGPEKIPRQGRLHPTHPQAQRPAFAGVPKQFPVTTAAGFPTVSTIVWDGDRDRWVAAPTAFVKGLPLYEVDTTWSREFEPLEPQAGQLTIEGGMREFDHWHAWEAAVPDGGDSTVALTIPQRDGPPKVIEQKLAPGRHTVQLQTKPNEDGQGGRLKLWIDDDQKFDFDLPFVFGEAFANHPPIVHILKPNESARLVHRLLKGTTATLRFEIRLSVPPRGISESPNS